MRVLLLILFACGPRPSAPPAAATAAPPVSAEPAGLSERVLVGRIWEAATGQFVDRAVAVDALRAADWRLLGEKHDNPEHHLQQAALIAALAPPAVVFEQLDDGDAIGEPASPAALAESVAWSDSGWPEFSLYAPVFQATLDAGASILAGHPTRDQLRGKAPPGEGLALDRTLDEVQVSELTDEIVEAHCGHADPHTVAMMIEMQRLKDAWMARALTRFGPGAVLVAGNGHTRRDRGVPHYLDGSAVVVSFREVIRGEADPVAYEEPADFVWFTERVDDEDPCEAFRAQLEKMGQPK